MLSYESTNISFRSNPSPKIFRKYSLNSTNLMAGWNSSSRNSFVEDPSNRWAHFFPTICVGVVTRRFFKISFENWSWDFSYGKDKPSKWWHLVEKMTGRRKSTTGLENAHADFLSNQRTRSERDTSPTNSIRSFQSIAEVTRPIDLASTIWWVIIYDSLWMSHNVELKNA